MEHITGICWESLWLPLRVHHNSHIVEGSPYFSKWCSPNATQPPSSSQSTLFAGYCRIDEQNSSTHHRVSGTAYTSHSLMELPIAGHTLHTRDVRYGEHNIRPMSVANIAASHETLDCR